MIDVRLADGDDSLDGLADLASRAFLASPLFSGIDEERYTVSKIRASFSGGRPLVAVEDGKPVGTVTLFPPEPGSACEAFKTSPHLGLMAVDPAAGNRGVGTRLIEAVEELAQSTGFSTLALSVTSRGDELIHFYESRGYDRVGEHRWPGATGPSVIMVKTLS